MHSEIEASNINKRLLRLLFHKKPNRPKVGILVAEKLQAFGFRLTYSIRRKVIALRSNGQKPLNVTGISPLSRQQDNESDSVALANNMGPCGNAVLSNPPTLKRPSS